MTCSFCGSDRDVKALDDEHRACRACRTGRVHPAIRPGFRELVLDASGIALAEVFAHTQSECDRRASAVRVTFNLRGDV